MDNDELEKVNMEALLITTIVIHFVVFVLICLVLGAVVASRCNRRVGEV